MAVEELNIVFQGPLNLEHYVRSRRPTHEQLPGVPKPFLDCMAVREEVFVKGQNIPIELEADSDDCRSCHWVAYIGEKPVGNVRMVPFPHDPHPVPGASYDLPENPSTNGLRAEIKPWIVDRATSLHDGREPYVKLGRMAVIEEYRGRGTAGRLVRAVLDWASANPDFFNDEARRTGQDDPGPEASMTEWNGLVCIHAQEYVANAWQSWGFKVDEKMGRWSEANIPHVGMFMRLKVHR
jgi:predicted GNAT family N-acyltransferase